MNLSFTILVKKKINEINLNNKEIIIFKVYGACLLLFGY